MHELYDLWEVPVFLGIALYFERRWRSARRHPWDRRLALLGVGVAALNLTRIVIAVAAGRR